jgi:hypothetical protein
MTTKKKTTRKTMKRKRKKIQVALEEVEKELGVIGGRFHKKGQSC